MSAPESPADHAATVREALKARQRGTGSTRNTAPAFDALDALATLADRATELERERDGLRRIALAAEATATDQRAIANHWRDEAVSQESRRKKDLMLAIDALHAFEWLDKKKHDRASEAWLSYFDEATETAREALRAALGETAR